MATKTATKTAKASGADAGELAEGQARAILMEAIEPACTCGCGEPVHHRASFRPGHDSRHKGNLLRAARAGDGDARAELRFRGWADDARIDAVPAKDDPARAERARRRLEERAARLRAELAGVEARLAAL